MDRGIPKRYERFIGDIASLLEEARRQSARAVNAFMTATYREIGRRILEFEQSGQRRAGYGEELLQRLSQDLTEQFGRGFSQRNLRQMRLFYLTFPPSRIWQTPSAKSDGGIPRIQQTTSQKSLLNAPSLRKIAARFPLPWSAYVRLLSLSNEYARAFYETEALRGGWSVRQLDRQINTQFYERTALSRNKAAMLKKGPIALPSDTTTPEEEIKDPYVLEFLGLKDEYSESDLEEALVRRLEEFLLELGGDFTFVARQKRLRIGDEWHRVDLVFFHRVLHCLMLVDLKLGKFTYADAGQMHLYLNYAREHWTRLHENPPVGLILCAQKNNAVAKYALEGLANKVLAAEYRTTLPDERLIAEELERSRRILDQRGIPRLASSRSPGMRKTIKRKRNVTVRDTRRES